MKSTLCVVIRRMRSMQSPCRMVLGMGGALGLSGLRDVSCCSIKLGPLLLGFSPWEPFDRAHKPCVSQASVRSRRVRRGGSRERKKLWTGHEGASGQDSIVGETNAAKERWGAAKK